MAIQCARGDASISSDQLRQIRSAAVLFSVSTLKGYAIEAEDGKVGEIEDMLFDDRSWRARWLVVDTGSWLSGRSVLIHPSAVIGRNSRCQELAIRLTKARIPASPDIGLHRPVSRQIEAALHDYYGSDPTWGGSILGAGAMTEAFRPSPRTAAGAAVATSLASADMDEGDPHLRSMTAVEGSYVHAQDGMIGHVADFLVDDIIWTVCYLIIDTRNWWPGEHVLMSPHAVKDIDWPDHRIGLNVTRGQVRSSPYWKSSEAVVQAYQERLHNHYTWPGYGW
jgi:hypothetical protein